MIDMQVSGDAAAFVLAAQTEPCRAKIIERLGDIGRFVPAAARTSGKSTIVSGTVDKLEKPPAARAGGMAPLHVIATRYSFRCSLKSGAVQHISFNRVAR